MARFHADADKSRIKITTELEFQALEAERGAAPVPIVGPRGPQGDQGPPGGIYPQFAYLIDAPGGFVTKVNGKVPGSALPDSYLNPPPSPAAPGSGPTYTALITRTTSQTGSNALLGFNRVDYDPHGFVDPLENVGYLKIPASIGDCWVRLTCFWETSAINSLRTFQFIQDPNAMPGTRKLLAANTGRGAHMISPWVQSTTAGKFGVLFTSSIVTTPGVPWLQIEARKRS